MREAEFRAWLINENGQKAKVVSDITSRLKRIERELTKYLGEDIELDNEYQKDGCERIKKMISFHGVKKMPEKVNLIRKRYHIPTLTHALKKYILFNRENKG